MLPFLGIGEKRRNENNKNQRRKGNGNKGAKRKGATYDALFTSEALSRGLNVLQAVGDYLPYDLVVENQHGVLIKVQVKGTSHKQKGKNNTYHMTVGKADGGGSKRKLSTEDADVLAAYAVLDKTWYHIPLEHLKGITVHFRPTEKSSAQYEVWKEAWNVYQTKV